MPSDHASLFVGFAVAILCIHRGFGSFLMVWALFVVSLPRIISGLHWPSDIFAGAVVGTACVLALLPLLTILVRKTGIIHFFEAREALGYPLLFVASYEIASMFSTTRYVVVALLT